MGEPADRPCGERSGFVKDFAGNLGCTSRKASYGTSLLVLPDARAGMCIRRLETGPARMGAAPANIARLYAGGEAAQRREGESPASRS